MLYAIVDLLDVTPGVTKLHKELDRYWLAVALYNLFIRRFNPSFPRDPLWGLPYICLARGTQFYSGKYLDERPQLQGFIGNGGLTHRRAQKISRYLKATGIIDEQIGHASMHAEIIFSPEGHVERKVVIEPLKGEMTRLVLKPESVWNFTPHKLTQILNLILGVKKTEDVCPAIFRQKYVNADGRTIIETSRMPEGCIQQIERINAFMQSKLPVEYHNLMSYRWIAGENLQSHMRLYAPITSIKKEARNTILHDLGLVEHDISSCALNIAHIIETGKFFSSELFGGDVYSDMIHEYFCGPGKQNKKQYSNTWEEEKSECKLEQIYLRPLFKEIMTIGQGSSYKSRGQVVARVFQLLLNNGLLMDTRAITRKMKAWLKAHPGANQRQYDRELDHLQFEAREQKKERWAGYLAKHGLSNREWRVPYIHPRALVTMLFETPKYAPMAKYLFNGSFKITTNVETFANLMLHDYAISKGIYIHTLHDAFYTKPQHMEELKEKQMEFLQVACALKREELRILSWNPIIKQIREEEWMPAPSCTKREYHQEVNNKFYPAIAEGIINYVKAFPQNQEQQTNKYLKEAASIFDSIFFQTSISSREGILNFNFSNTFINPFDLTSSSAINLIRNRLQHSFLCSYNFLVNSLSPTLYLVLNLYTTTLRDLLNGLNHGPPVLELYAPGKYAEAESKIESLPE